MSRGAQAEQRRRERRLRDGAAGSSRALGSVAEDEHAGGATTFRDLPLSDRDRPWDADAALARWQTACGIRRLTLDVDGDGPDWDRYRTGFMWVDPDGDGQLDSHHLLFVDVEEDGTTTAVWRAITECAGAIRGAEHADLSALDEEDRVRAHIERYFSKARSIYDDPGIVAPWTHDTRAGAVMALAYAESRRTFTTSEYLGRLAAWAEEFMCEIRPVDPDAARDSDGPPAILAEGGVTFEVVEVTPERWALERARREVFAGEAITVAFDTTADLQTEPTDEQLRELGAFVREIAARTRASRVTLAAGDDMARCDDCGHEAMAHGGDDNSGACTMDGCGCEAYVAPDGETSAKLNAMRESLQTSATTTVDSWMLTHLNTPPPVNDFRLFRDSFGEPAGTFVGHDLTSGGDRRATDRELFFRALERATEEVLANEETLAAALEERVTFHLEKLEIVVEPEADLPDVEAPVVNGEVQWTAMIIPEGTLTDDGRAFAPGAITWRELPLTLCAMLDSPHADVVTKAEACGRIDRIWREGNLIHAEGVFDTGEYGQKMAQMVSDRTLRGISVDVAVHASEVRPKGDFFDENGNWRDVPLESDVDMLDVLFGEPDPSVEPIFVVTEGVIGSVTVCPFPAFADARIVIAASLVAGASPAVCTFTAQHSMVITRPNDGVFGPIGIIGPMGHEGPVGPVGVTGPRLSEVLASGGIVPRDGERIPLLAQFGEIVLNPTQVERVSALAAAGTATLEEILVAGGVAPDNSWFADPELEELTALTVTDDRRVFGHAAPWGVCHIGIPDICTTAPHSLTGYECFLLKEVVCADGSRVHVGTITLDTGHADRGLGRDAATRHYDHTGTAVADVAIGEDEHGIWVAGAIRPYVSDETVAKLRGAVLSGDWRQVELDDGSRNLELVALLAVNVPGFPVPRTRANIVASIDEAGKPTLEVYSLVAAGIHFGESDEARANKISALADIAAGKYAELLERAKAA